MYAVFVKYALINLRSPNQYTISIDQHVIDFNQEQHQDHQHQDKQAKQAQGSAGKGIEGISI